MCINGNYSRSRIGNSPLKDGFEKRRSSTAIIFHICVQYVITRIPAKQETLKLNGVHQFLVKADDVNIPGGNKHNIKKGTKGLVVASKVTGME